MPSTSGKKYLLLISAGGSFLAPFMVSSLIVAIPTIGIEFSMDAVAMSWLGAAFFLAASMFLIPFGRIADIFGVKRVFTAGIYIYFFSALLAALAPGQWILIAARFLTGMGAAMIFGTSFAMLSLSLSEKERGGALGINIASNWTGFGLGFLFGGMLTYYISWRVIFLIVLPIALLVIALIHKKLPGECALSRGQRLDLPGAVMIISLLFMTIFGFSDLPKARGLAILGAGFLILLAFIRRELRNDSPLIDMRLFLRNRCFALSNGAILVYFTATFAVIFLFSLYLQYIKSFDSRSAGLVLLVSTLMMTPLVALAGRLSDRYSPHSLATAAIVLTAAGLLPMAFISSSTPIGLAFAELLLIMAGGALFSPPTVKLILGSIAREMYGVGSSLAEKMRLIGNTASMAITTVVFALYIGSENIMPENYPAFLESMRLFVAVSFVLCILSTGMAFFAGRAKAKLKR
jgi:MFS family permease